MTASSVKRFVARDVSTRHVVVAAMDDQQQLVLQPKKIAIPQFERWAQQHLSHADAVVLEATGNAWLFYDQLRPLVASVTIANPVMVKLIAGARVKTDARDAIHLARLLAANLIPTVWVPPQDVRDLRALVAQRSRLIRQRTQARNRLHALLHRHNLLPPDGEPFAQKNLGWWESIAVSPTERLMLKHELALLENLTPLITETEAELIRLSTSERWVNQARYVIQLPGMGVITTMIILSAIGDVTRFASAKQLVGYSGLGASVFATGQTFRTGTITKQGRAELRTALVEAAWIAVAYDAHWKEVFTRLSVRMGRGKAIVAVARKLLVVIWHVLTKHEADRLAVEEHVARKILNWGAALRKQGRHGLRFKAFLRQELDYLAIGADLTTITWNGKPYAVPPASPGTG